MIPGPLVAVGLVVGAQTTPAPPVEVRVVPETITVGSRFVYRVRVHAPGAAGVAFPAAWDTGGVVAPVAPARVRADRAGDWVAEYEGTAWAPGVHEIPPLRAVVRDSGGATRDVAVAGARVVVRSVLPAEADGLALRPPKEVWGRDRPVWLDAAAALVGLALVAVAALLWRRWRRRRRRVPAVAVDARAVALAALDALEHEGMAWLAAGDAKAYYTQLSQILRYYLHALRPAWSPDCTTSELLLRMREDGAESYDAFELADILGEADLVKFAPVRASPRDALALTERARAWIAEFRPPEPSAPLVEQPVGVGGEAGEAAAVAEAAAPAAAAAEVAGERPANAVGDGRAADVEPGPAGRRPGPAGGTGAR